MTTTHDQLKELETLVKILTVELMDYGGTNPYATCEVIAEEAPELCNLFGEDHVLALCKLIQRSEIREESTYFQRTFRSSNKTYFAGHLPEYEVRVVYDIDVWVGEVSRNPTAGYIDLGRRQIFIRLSNPRSLMEATLIHEMAHASADPSHGDKWISEMNRLKGLGAPVEECELD